MNSQNGRPTRDQKIFTLGLEVEAVSLYLLCCGLVDAKQHLCLATIIPTWNLDRSALVVNLEVLLSHNIIVADGPAGEEATRFRLKPSSGWRQRRTP